MAFITQRCLASLALSSISTALLSSAYAQAPAAQTAANRAPPPPVSSQPVAGRVHVLSGGGGANATLLIGPDAVLLVDSKSAGATDQIVATAKHLGGGPIRFLVNGHEHPDHTGGNANFGKLGVTIVANEGVRTVLAAGQRGGPPEPPEALPTITFPTGGELP